MESTDCVIDGEEIQIFKDPKTDDGVKKSQKGTVVVYRSNGKISYSDGHSLNTELSTNLLQPIFLDGKLVNEVTFAQIRALLAGK